MKTEPAQSALAYVQKMYEVYSRREGWTNMLERWERMCGTVITGKNYRGQSDITSPDIRQAVKTLVNYIDEVVSGADPNFTMRGVDKKDRDMTETIVNMFRVQMHNMRFRKEQRRAIKSLVKYGMCITKDGWKQVRGKKVKASDRRAYENGKSDVAGAVTTKYDSAFFEALDIKTVFFDPYCKWENQQCIIEERFVDESALRSMERAGLLTGVDDFIASQENPQTVSKGSDHAVDETGFNREYARGRDMYQLWEVYLSWDIDGDGIDEECRMFVLDGKVEAGKLHLNPYDHCQKPYRSTAWEEVEGTCVGIGAPGLAEKHGLALNDFVNQLMDSFTMTLNGMWIVDEQAADIPDYQLKSRPNGVVRVANGGTEAVRPVDRPSVANEGLRAIAMAKDDIRMATGAVAAMQGMPSRYDTSATEAATMVQASQRDIMAVIRDYEDCVFLPFLSALYKYDSQYMVREDFIKLLGEEAAHAWPSGGKSLFERCKSDLDFIPLGATQYKNKTVSAQQKIALLNVLVPFLANGSLAVDTTAKMDLAKFIKTLAREMGDAEDYITAETRELLDPRIENLLFERGQPVQANKHDDHVAHVEQHMHFDMPEAYVGMLKDHIEEHRAFIDQASGMTVQAGARPDVARPGGVGPQEIARMGMPNPATPAELVRQGGV